MLNLKEAIHKAQVNIGTPGSPFINEPVFFAAGGVIFSNRLYSAKVLMDEIVNTPECIGIIKSISTDIFTEFEFKAIEKKGAGRPAKNLEQSKVDKAKEYANNNFIKQELQSAGMEWLGTGDGYIWSGMDSKTIMKEIVKEIYEKSAKDTDITFKEILDEQKPEIDGFKYVPAETMKIDYDATTIKGYQQEIATDTSRKRYWAPNEIIHAKFMSMRGKVHGFSPMTTCLPVIRTIRLIQDYAGKWFDGGGIPDMILNFPKEMANSPAYKAAKQQLETYKNSRKRGIMTFTGEVNVEKLNEFNKDIEFRQLAIYYTGRIAFAFNMPADKFRPILGVDIKSSAGGSDNDDSGYWRSIEEAQVYWETLLNTQLFNPKFGVSIRFKRKFPQDMVRVMQATTQAITVADWMLQKEYPVTDEYFHHILQIPRDFIKEGELKRGVEPMEGQFAMPMSNKKVMSGPKKQKMQTDKQKQAIGV